MKLISRIGMMITHPKRVFPFVKEEKTRKAWVYLLFVLFFANIPFLVLGIIVFNKYFAPIFKDLSIVVFWIAFITSILTVPNITLMLAIIFGTLVLKISFKVAKEKIKYTEILRIVIYAFTPFLLIFWLPPFSFGAMIWSIVLMARGLIGTYDIPRKKMLGVIFLYVIIGIIFGFVIYLIS